MKFYKKPFPQLSLCSTLLVTSVTITNQVYSFDDDIVRDSIIKPHKNDYNSNTGLTLNTTAIKNQSNSIVEFSSDSTSDHSSLTHSKEKHSQNFLSSSGGVSNKTREISTTDNRVRSSSLAPNRQNSERTLNKDHNKSYKQLRFISSPNSSTDEGSNIIVEERITPGSNSSLPMRERPGGWISHQIKEELSEDQTTTLNDFSSHIRKRPSSNLSQSGKIPQQIKNDRAEDRLTVSRDPSPVKEQPATLSPRLAPTQDQISQQRDSSPMRERPLRLSNHLPHYGALTSRFGGVFFPNSLVNNPSSIQLNSTETPSTPTTKQLQDNTSRSSFYVPTNDQTSEIIKQNDYRTLINREKPTFQKDGDFWVPNCELYNSYKNKD